FYLGDPAAGGTLLGNTATSRTLAPGEYEDVSVRWADETTGSHTIFVTVDAANECEETNNDYQQRVDILDIPLVESWNLISGWVNPFYTDASVVQRPISGTYTVIQGFDGGALVYYPDLPAAVNTLKSIDAEHGYWIKMMNAERGTRNSSFSVPHSSFGLRLVGAAFPENRELALDAGWNLVSFLSRNEMGVMEGLRSIDGEYTAVLGFDQGALSYYPHLEPHFNTLWALRPLYGYWLKLTQESTLRYPRTQPDTLDMVQVAGADPDARQRALLARQAERTTGVQTTNTWVNFYGPARLADGKPAPAGALVQVFDADGVPCGAGIVTEPGLYGLLACYGDDPTTPADEGASPGDVLTFAIDGAPAPASAKAIWTVHGGLQWMPLGPVELWRVWLPVVGIGDLSRSRD
ncbi:MAG: CARDB domain-containing protein, partial [Anaerolineae bacterium]